ncbi:hypothetical protein BH09BAC1_BH09BAC1_14380 [soil metagenome]
METIQDKTTWAQYQQIKFDGNTRLICNRLGISEYTMFWESFEMGREYLRLQCQGDEWGIEMLKSEPMYWAWWRNQWCIRDEAFINSQGIGTIAKIYDGQQEALRLKYWHRHRYAMKLDFTEKGYLEVVSELVRQSTKSNHLKASRHE